MAQSSDRWYVCQECGEKKFREYSGQKICAKCSDKKRINRASLRKRKR